MRQDIYLPLRQALDDERLVALATIVAGSPLGGQLLLAEHQGATVDLAGGLGTAELDATARRHASELFTPFASGRFRVEGASGEVDLFIETHPPRAKLLVIGAVHAAIALVSFARTLGMRTVVIDPRSAFATEERFAHADRLCTDWPDAALKQEGINSNTYLALLSHDLKLDIPALRVALASNPRYIGALGSKKTHARRVSALREAGLSPEAIARIHNPIGLNLGGRKAEEIAVAVLAEIVAVSHGIGLR